MASLSEIRAKVARLGVIDPENPTPTEVKLILDAYLKEKSLDTDAFNTYVKSQSVSLKAMFEGFAQFSKDQGDVSKKTIDVIQRAMDILEGELKRENISDEGRLNLSDRIWRLVEDARDESDKERAFRSQLGRWAVGIFGIIVTIVGFVWVVVTLGRHPAVLEKGIELATIAFGKKLLS